MFRAAERRTRKRGMLGDNDMPAEDIVPSVQPGGLKGRTFSADTAIAIVVKTTRGYDFEYQNLRVASCLHVIIGSPYPTIKGFRSRIIFLCHAIRLL